MKVIINEKQPPDFYEDISYWERVISGWVGIDKNENVLVSVGDGAEDIGAKKFRIVKGLFGNLCAFPE